jgi:hypothetical protein
VRAPLRKTTLAALAAGAVLAPQAWADPPAPCGGTPQITDATDDGHHKNTDVLAAWLTETGGRLQAVIRVQVGLWEPAHDDSSEAGYALLYESGGAVRYVRARATPTAPPAYDHGTWTAAGGFVTAGATAGEVTTGPNGTVTMDVPGSGPVLARPFVLTYDGIIGPDAHWVDRAPGGVSADGAEFGADYVLGSCATGTPAPPGTTPTPTTTAIALTAPKKLTGAGRAKVTGKLTPARAGVAVDITATGRGTLTRRVTSGADGSFSVTLPLSETTRVRAVAEGLGSQTLTVKMYSKVRVKLRRLKSGTVVVSGTTSPKLGGRILWLRSNAVKASARTTARNGRFELRLKSPRPGRYQAVFIPSGDRAERSTSNSGVIR